jgi:hypothetical protein
VTSNNPPIPASSNSSLVPGFPAGLAIALATILSIAFVAMDNMATGKTPEAILQSLIAMRTTKTTVHAVAIASVLAYAYGYTALAARLDLRRPLVMAGLTTYLLGCAAMLGATIMDGFISSDVAAKFIHAGMASDPKSGLMLIDFMGIALSDLADLAWVLQAAAAIAWSVTLLREGQHQITALIGVVANAAVVGLVFSYGINMDMTAMMGTLIAQAVWNLAAATMLMRGKRDTTTIVAPLPQPV